MTLLIFDIDGTLTDTKGVDDQCFISAFQDEYQVALQNIDWADFKNVTDLGLFTDIFKAHFNKKPEKKDVKIFQKRFFTYLENALGEHPDNFKAVLGAPDFVKHCLALNDMKIAFATGGWRFSAKMKLQAAQIPFQNCPLSSSDNFITRQSILKNAIQQSKRHYELVHFDKILYFGDGIWDFKTTQALNMPFIGVDIRKDNVLKTLGVDYIIHNFLDKELISRYL